MLSQCVWKKSIWTDQKAPKECQDLIFNEEGEEEVWTGTLDNPYDISVMPCPFKMELQAELEHFEAHCEDVVMNDEWIAIPPNCKTKFKVRNHKEGVLIHKYCPVLIRLYRVEDEAI